MYNYFQRGMRMSCRLLFPAGRNIAKQNKVSIALLSQSMQLIEPVLIHWQAGWQEQLVMVI